MKNKLFHYNKAETLKLILESKKLKNSSLSKLDDNEEQWTSDMQNHGLLLY